METSKEGKTLNRTRMKGGKGRVRRVGGNGKRVGGKGKERMHRNGQIKQKRESSGFLFSLFKIQKG